MIKSKDYLEITNILSDHHSLFYKSWELGHPVFSKKVKKCKTTFDKKGNALSFIFNKEFWDRIENYDRAFCIGHECLHCVLDHGSRVQGVENTQAANIAMDLVVNHMLVSKFGFDREKLCIEDEVFWVDTVWPDKDIPEGKSFEYYYNLLNQKDEDENEDKQDQEREEENNQGSGGGSGSSKKKQDSKGDGDESNSDEPEESDEENEDEEDDKEGEEEDGEEEEGESEESEEKENADAEGDGEEDSENTEPDLLDDHDFENSEDIKDAIMEEADEDEVETMENLQQISAGTSPGNIRYKEKKERVIPKKKWETVIKKWSRQYVVPDGIDEQWAKLDRRFVFMSNDIILPSNAETEGKEKGKIDVWFYQDTSYSCKHLAERFFKAARTLNPKRFNVRMFCFDTRVYETSLKSGELYGFGGTRFDVLEQEIQNRIQTENIRYPEAVFVITDGLGNKINPEKPKNWHWFLSAPNVYCIHDDCNIYTLKDFE